MAEDKDIEEKLEGEETQEQPYSDCKVKMSKIQYSMFEIHRRYTNPSRNDFIIDPEFQRRSVWSSKQKSELIESILMGIPLPVFYFFENSEGQVQVVDGRQRLTTVFGFMDNKFKLQNLKIMQSSNGKRFEELSPYEQGKIEDYQLHGYLIQPPTPERIKFDIFDRVNRGGTRLNDQEMRNALYIGPATKLLKRIAGFEEFKQATGDGVKANRMKDQYLILRFISFYLYFTNNLQHPEIDEKELTYTGEREEFFTNVMKFLNKQNEAFIINIENVAREALRKSFNCLGEDGFRFDWSHHQQKRPINMALFEVIMFVFAHDSESKISQVSIEDLKKEFDANSSFINGVDNVRNVNHRFKKAKEFLKENGYVQVSQNQ